MKFLVLAAIVAVAAAAGPFRGQTSQDADAQVLRSTADVNPTNYNYGYETSNKIVADESGSLKNVGRDNEALEVQGQFSYISPEGTPVKVTYRADENGFQPDSSVLPVAPEPQPIPEYIQRAIRLLPIVRERK